MVEWIIDRFDKCHIETMDRIQHSKAINQSINRKKRRLPPGFQMIIPVNDYGNDTIQYIKHTLTV